MQEEHSQEKVKTYKDYYQVLRLAKNAGPEQIKEAFFKMEEEYSGKGTSGVTLDPLTKQRKIQEISDAYEVLSDPKQRQNYDVQLETNKKQAGDVRAIWSKFSSLVGTSSTNEPDLKQLNKKKSEASSLAVEVNVSLREAIKGARRTIVIFDPTRCDSCAGLKPVNRLQCPFCKGVGHYQVERKEEVTLPTNLSQGMEIRKPGLGPYDLAAEKKGDLIIKIQLNEHTILALKGNDICCTVPVTLYEAILGADIEVPTATGKVVMKIQPMTQPGQVYRLKGLGLAGADELITVDILIPKNLSSEEIALFQQLKAAAGDQNPRLDLLSTQK